MYQYKVLFTSLFPEGSPGLTLQAGRLQGLRSLACYAVTALLHTSVPSVDEAWWLQAHRPPRVQSLSSWSISPAARTVCCPSVLGLPREFQNSVPDCWPLLLVVSEILFRQNSGPVTLPLVTLRGHLLWLGACCPRSRMVLLPVGSPSPSACCPRPCRVAPPLQADAGPPTQSCPCSGLCYHALSPGT